MLPDCCRSLPQFDVLVTDLGQAFVDLLFGGDFSPSLCGTKAPEFNQGTDADVKSAVAENTDFLRELNNPSGVR